MIPYMGSKNKYGQAISDFIWRFARRREDQVLWDCCCGSGWVSYYWPRQVVMLDAGPWGRFWEIVHEHDIRDFSVDWNTDELRRRAFKYINLPQPEDPIEWAIAFLLVQNSAFNRKPITDNHGMWQTPGVTVSKNLSENKWEKIWQRISRMKPRIKNARRLNIHDIKFENKLVYVDPDYQGTTGYQHGVDVPRFIETNEGSYIWVSHHEVIDDVDWKYIQDITKGTRTFSRSSEELLHFHRSIHYDRDKQMEADRKLEKLQLEELARKAEKRCNSLSTDQ